MKKTPSPLVALFPVAFLIVQISLSVAAFGSSSLDGASQVVLLETSALVVFIGMVFYGTKWADIERCLINNVSGVTTAILILFAIGALSSMWMLGGIVPTLIVYGLEIISPRLFLASCCVICALVSIMTGSSWTTIATIGMALIGIGRAMGYSDGWIAGAIISGAYFGDKMSPLSDTTVLASSTCEVPLFTHIRYMVYTTIPSITIALLVFFVVGLMSPAASVGSAAAFEQAVCQRFVITPWLLVVPVLTGCLIARKTPALITLVLSALMALIAYAVVQPDVLHEVADGGDIYEGLLKSIYGPTAISASNAMLQDLVSTNGMAGMLNTVWLIICAITFGGVMQATGMLDSLTRMFIRLARGTVSLVSGSVMMGILLNTITSDQYLSIILGGKMFSDAYKRRGEEARLLSRSVEDGTTVTSVLVPWNSCGMTQATVLGVATTTYLPYTVFCYVSPLMSIVVAALFVRHKKNIPANR